MRSRREALDFFAALRMIFFQSERGGRFNNNEPRGSDGGRQRDKYCFNKMYFADEINKSPRANARTRKSVSKFQNEQLYALMEYFNRGEFARVSNKMYARVFLASLAFVKLSQLHVRLFSISPRERLFSGAEVSLR